MPARYDDPAIGRFLSVDPVQFANAGPGYFNRYAYVGSNPLNATDPTGMEGEAGFLEVQGAFVIGHSGGRFSLGVGYNSETRGLFVYAVGGGQLDPIYDWNGVNGLQLGLGASGGVAENADFIVAPAYTTDVDLSVVSGSVAANDSLIYLMMGSHGDNQVRQGSAGIGVGIGASEVRTQGVRSGELDVGPALDWASGVADGISERVQELGDFSLGGVGFQNVQVSEDGTVSGQYTRAGSRIRRNFEVRSEQE